VEAARTQVGQMTLRDIVDYPRGVAKVPFDEQDRGLVVSEYRPAIGTTLLEIPAGILESSESADETASRELREETGMCSERLERIAEFYLDLGYTTELKHVFLATEFSHDQCLQTQMKT
jgi:ADP-ribose pyrophosphatase